ncbi:hypothetical protein, conserved [Leishmania tarentolae]|uniref:Uncharacterized protein n=1 Tax=Leishmania tarentolae TaxID=5689 RepID=A0A640KP53_LEITA|nr:hypothetical protein, conserved [Leishmania tarentolae]
MSKTMSDTASHQSAKIAERERVPGCAKPLRQEGATTPAAASKNPPSIQAESRVSQPAMASHSTRGASSCHPSRQLFPDDHERFKIESPSKSRAAVEVAFSLENTPLAGTRPPPVWCESSPFTASCGSQNSLTHLSTLYRRMATLRNSSSGVSAPGTNLFTDVEREISNQRRRYALVRHFFVSHEGVIRLNIQLQQLLKYRDLCEAEVHERLQSLPPVEAGVAAHPSARCGGVTETEYEIERVQVDLARVASSSLQLAGTLEDMDGVLAPLQSATRSHQASAEDHRNCIPSAADIERAGRRSVRNSVRSLNKDILTDTKRAGKTKPSIENSVDISESFMATHVSSTCDSSRSDSLGEPLRTSAVTTATNERPPSQPHVALAAGCMAQKVNMLSAETTARSTEPSQTQSAGVTESHDMTSRPSTEASDFTHASLSATLKLAVESATTTDTKTWPGETHFSSPQRMAESTDDNEKQGGASVKATPPPRTAIDGTGLSTPRSDHKPESWLLQTVASHRLSAPPQQPSLLLYSTKAKVTSAPSEEPHHPSSTTTPRATVLVDTPNLRTPMCAQGQRTFSSLADSPLARYRAKQANRNLERQFCSPVEGAPRHTSSDRHSPSHQAAATGAPTGVQNREKGECFVTSTRVSSATRNATLHGDPATLIEERRRPGPVKSKGNPDASPSTSAALPRDKSPLPTRRWSTTPCASLARPSSTPSPRPRKWEAAVRKPPFEGSFSSAAAVESLPPPHARGFNVPPMGQWTEFTAAAVSRIPSHPPKSSAHPSLSDDTQQRLTSPMVISAALDGGSTTPSTHFSAACTSTDSAMPAMNWNASSQAAIAVMPPPPSGSAAFLTRNGDLPSDKVTSWSPSDAAVEPYEKLQEGGRYAEVNAGVLMGGTAHDRSAELRVGGSHSIWEEVRALEIRVEDLESRTTALEKNAEKRAVLEVIGYLKARVDVLEEGTTLLEQRSNASHLRIC